MSYQREMRKSLVLLTVAGVFTFGAVAINAFSPKNARFSNIPAETQVSQTTTNSQTTMTNAHNSVASTIPFTRSNPTQIPGNLNSERLQIEAMQMSLKEQGFYDGDIDGLMGPNTESAITMYRIAFQVPQSFTTPAQILNHMRGGSSFTTSANINRANTHQNDTIGALSSQMPTPRNVTAGQTTASVNMPASQGITDPNIVKNVQSVLAEFTLDPGPRDGQLGLQTVNAIKEFQRYKRMPITGRIDDELINSLEKISRRNIRN